MMDIAQKTRASRAWLNWTQEDLVKQSGLSLAGIQTIERGESSPTVRTLKKLESAFADAYVFFTQDGIECRPYQTRTYNSFVDILEDAYSTLEPDQEIIMHCADESRSSDAVNQMLQKIRRKGLILRMTLKDGDTNISGEPEFYRWIDPDLFMNSQVEVIYGDKFVFHLQEDERNFFVMTHNKAKSRNARKQFEYHWKNGKTWDEIQMT